MAKKVKKTIKTKCNISKSKKQKNLIVIKNNKRNKMIKFYDKNEYITDLSFIDKYEEDEKQRIKNKENENLIEIQNKKLYTLKICYRPATNNIELIGKYLEDEETNKLKNNKNPSNHILFNNKCSYLLIQDNIIVVPILNEDISKIDNNKNNDNNHIVSNKSEKENIKNPYNQKNINK